tara:strand:- start:186 stop:584 length:399 start_codon:yes stop_codon:yes gene_type:complete
MLETFISYIPSYKLALLYSLLSIARFENQRWIRQRAAGIRGSSVAGGLFIDATGWFSMIFSFGFLISYGYDIGVWHALILYFIILVISTAVSALITVIVKGDSLIMWIIGTLAIYPLAILLVHKVSWFGMLF